MRTRIYTFIKALALGIVLTATINNVSAQWSESNILFPGEASPEPGPFWVAPVIVAEKDASGTIHLVWANKVSDEANVLAHAAYSNGSWSQMEILPSIPNSSAMLPSLTISPDGRLHVSYTCMLPDGSWGIAYTSKSTGADDWSLPVIVSQAGFALNAYAQIFCDNQQMPHVLYIAFGDDGESSFLKHVKFSSSNPSQTEQMAVPANSTGAFNPKLVKSANGNVQCFWYVLVNEEEKIMYSSYDGSLWSATEIIATSSNGLMMDEASIVPVATGMNELYAFWYSMDPEAGMYRKYTPGSGWTAQQQVDDAAFVMASGISDNPGNIHIAGNLNDNLNEIYDMKYHRLQGNQWIHEVIEPATSEILPTFPVMVISGDTLYCFYLRYFESGSSQLIERWKVLDYLTPVKDIQVNKAIALKVYPNPVQHSSMVTLNTPVSGVVTFTLTGILGRTETISMMIQDPGTISIELSDLFQVDQFKGTCILQVVTPAGRDNAMLVF